MGKAASVGLAAAVWIDLLGACTSSCWEDLTFFLFKGHKLCNGVCLRGIKVRSVLRGLLKKLRQLIIHIMMTQTWKTWCFWRETWALCTCLSTNNKGGPYYSPSGYKQYQHERSDWLHKLFIQSNCCTPESTDLTFFWTFFSSLERNCASGANNFPIVQNFVFLMFKWANVKRVCITHTFDRIVIFHMSWEFRLIQGFYLHCILQILYCLCTFHNNQMHCLV